MGIVRGHAEVEQEVRRDQKPMKRQMEELALARHLKLSHAKTRIARVIIFNFQF